MLRSLAVRLNLRLLGIILVTVSITAVVDTVWIEPPSGPIYVWWNLAEPLLIRSVTRDPNGGLRIVPSSGLRHFKAMRPHFDVGAVDPATGEVAQGSAGWLVAALSQPGGHTLNNAVLPIVHDGVALDAGADRRDTASGTVVLLMAGDKTLRTTDYVGFALGIAKSILIYLVPATLAMMALSFATVRAVTAPLRAAGRQIANIDFRDIARRLPDDRRIPSEVLPLVQGVNRALDRLQEGSVRQQRFVANAAHEMRTPLAILRARIDSMPPQSGRADLQRDLQRIASLVDQMLAVSRLTHSNGSFEVFDLAALAAGVVSSFVPLALDVGRDLSLSAGDGAIPVRGNRRAIESALSNLIDNALAAEPAGGHVAVTVRTDAAIEVCDHGRGVDPDERELIFEPFWRRDEKRTGTGLGLAIVREIAQQHGGHATVRRTEGGGATFVLALPPARTHARRADTSPR